MAALHCFRQARSRSRRAAIYGGRSFRECLRKDPSTSLRFAQDDNRTKSIRFPVIPSAARNLSIVGSLRRDGARLPCMAALHCFRQARSRSRRAAIYGGRGFRECLRKGFACGWRKILRRFAPLNDSPGGATFFCHSERSEESSRPQTRSPVLASPSGGGALQAALVPPPLCLFPQNLNPTFC